MADLPINDTRDGGSPVIQSASAGGDSFRNDGQTIIKATGPSTGFTLIFGNGRQCEFGDHQDYRIEVPAGATSVETPRFDPYRFNDKSGRVGITYEPSAVGITIGAFRYHEHLKD